MLDTVAVSLEAAEFASSTVALLAEHPEFERPMKRSIRLLNCALVRAATRPRHPVRGQVLDPTAPDSPVEAIRRRSVRVQAPEPERSAEEAWEPEPVRDGKRCQALLLEILRRAMHDWVLYRQHKKMQLRELADDAYTWLFEEAPGHPNWRHRASAEFEEDEALRGSRQITSFLAICEALDLDPEQVRTRVREMDVRSIISAGRPAETRKARPEGASVEECAVAIDVNVDHSPEDANYVSQYESLGNVSTPDVLPLSAISGIY